MLQIAKMPPFYLLKQCLFRYVGRKHVETVTYDSGSCK